MKVLIVCSGNFEGGIENIFKHQAFIYEQVEALKEYCQLDYFLIKGKGIKGYLSNVQKLRKFLKNENFDLIHVHSGLSALLVSVATNTPFVVTYHGSDINNMKTRFLSILPITRSKANIFVSETLKRKSFLSKSQKNYVIPCGVNPELFAPVDKMEARKSLGLELNSHIVVFSSAFDNAIKNFEMTKRIVDKSGKKIDILEIKDRSREEVALLLNASDVLILTSLSEGSPQIIKEALSCNCPILSVDVGDVKSRIKGVDNSYIIDENNGVMYLEKVLKSNSRSNGRSFLDNLDNNYIAKRVFRVYKNSLK